MSYYYLQSKNLDIKRIALVLIISCFSMSSEATIRVTDLKVLSISNPVGIGTPLPDFSWQWQTDKRESFQRAYQILVASSKEELRHDVGDIWNSGKINSDQQLYISFKGKTLQSAKTYYWKIKIWDNHNNVSSWSDPAFFTMGLLNSTDWKAKWITYNTSKATAQPIFRKQFFLNKKIKSAVVYVSGLGYYELYLNGKKVGDHVLDPGQTNYDDYALYVSYDISQSLRKGENAVGVMLGDGWYNQDKVWAPNGFSYGNPLLICQLNIVYEDGSKQVIQSDQNWLWTNGPVIKSNVYAGEVYDARKEITGWSKTMRSEKAWLPVSLASNHPPKLIAQSLPPIKRMKELTVKTINRVAQGTYVFDFGQNFAGWTRLKVNAPAGTKLTIVTSEEIFPDGKLNVASTGAFATLATQTDQYICKGAGKEIWEPRFTYHGFRYAEISGLVSPPDSNTLTGIVVYSSVTDDGTFSCSDEAFNKLHHLAQWTLISNLYSIPTDCPAREKCGWLGDAHAIAKMSIYNHGMEAFFTKYLYDIRSSSQRVEQTYSYKAWNIHEAGLKPEGIPFMIAPGKREFGTASPDWGTAVVQLPWYLYLYYGQKEVLRKFYPDMKKWVLYVNGLARDHLVNYGLGDWCPPDRIVPLEPPISLSSTAFHYLDLTIMKNAASILGFEEDATQFNKELEKVKMAFQRTFYDPQLKTFGGQTANAMALDMGLVPAGDEESVSDQIAELSKDSLGGFLNTGIFGLSRIFNALSQNGNEKGAFDILTKKGYNSFEYMWSQYHATTLWEILPVDSFYLNEGDKGDERSHNHPMQAGYDQWFYNNVLGIRPEADAPGFKNIHLEPEMIGQLNWAKGSYHSVYGRIGSAWKRKEDSLVWEVKIPANTSATLYMPTRSDQIYENGRLISESKDVHLIGENNGKMVCRVGSGTYLFSIKLN